MASKRTLLTNLLLASTMLAAMPAAAAQIPEAPNQDPTAADPLTPPQGPLPSAASRPGEDTIVVTGRYIPNEKRETAAIVSLLSQEALQRTGDADIGAALTRVTGLSLVGGRFVYVRGLGGRYSSALLDGSVLPSPEPLRRIVPLDAFPTELLQGALIQKTYSPEYPGEFGGGLIALRSRGVPDKDFFEFGISGGINDNSSFRHGLSFKGGGLDNIGFGNERYELPRYVKTNPSLAGFNESQLALAGRSLVNNGPRFSIDREDNPADIDVNLTVGKRFMLGDMDAGFVLAGSFDSQFRNNFGVRNRYASSDTGLQSFSSFSPDACAGYNVDPSTCGLFQTVQSVRLGVVGTFGVDIDMDNSVKATTTLLRNTNKIADIRRGQTPINDPANVVSDQRLSFIEQELWTNQLSGEHKFGLGGLFSEGRFAWRGSYARASRVTPYQTDYRYILAPGEDAAFELSPTSSRNSILFTGLVDDNYEGGGDLTLTGALGDMETVVKLGGIYTKKERSFASRRYSFNIPVGTNELRSYVPEIIFSTDNIGPGGLQLDMPTARSLANAFDAGTEIYGGYANAELQLLRQVRLTGGVRYEHSKQTVTGVLATSLPDGSRCIVTGPAENFTTPITCELTADYFLPAASLTYEFADNMQLRFAFSRTLSRPDLRELSPATILDIEEDLNVVGNPNLRITRLTNYDARYEWYFGPQQIFSLGGFYKKLRNPIERTLTPFGDGNQVSFINARSAEVYGGEAEMELTVPFDRWFGGGFFDDRRFFVIGNVTYAKSSVSIDPAQQGVLTNLKRRLEGQSEVLANAQFGFEREGERMAVLLNYTGDRIQNVGTFGVPDVIENPPISLDFTAAKTFTVSGRELEVGFKVSNILDDDFRRTQGGLIYERYDLGRTFSLGLKARM